MHRTDDLVNELQWFNDHLNTYRLLIRENNKLAQTPKEKLTDTDRKRLETLQKQIEEEKKKLVTEEHQIEEKHQDKNYQAVSSDSPGFLNPRIIPK